MTLLLSYIFGVIKSLRVRECKNAAFILLGAEKWATMFLHAFFSCLMIFVKVKPYLETPKSDLMTPGLVDTVLVIRIILSWNSWKHLAGQTNYNRFTTEVKKEEWTHLQSPELKRVDLTVSTHKFKHYKMFGTLTEKKDGDYQDPCSGDSGGPLMYQMKNSRRWVIIGQFQ